MAKKNGSLFDTTEPVSEEKVEQEVKEEPKKQPIKKEGGTRAN